MEKSNTINFNNRRFSKNEYRWSFFLPVAFLFVQYGYGLGNLMLTYCILFSGYCVIKYSDFPIFKPLSVYTLWYVFVLLCTVLFFGHTADRPFLMKLIQIIISGYCVTIIAKHLDKEALYRCWKVVGLIVCAIIAYQFFQIFFLHQSVQPIRLLPVKSDELLRNENWTRLSNRPIAFFTEPAIVVSYLIPVLLFAQQKKELWVSIIVSIAILLTGSSSGVIALIIMWSISVVNYKSTIAYRLFVILVILVAVYAFLNLSYFSESLDKINYEMSGDSSNMNTRMLRGWWIYGDLDTRSKIFGISDYDISSYVYGNAWQYTWQTGYEDNFYLNTAQRILIQTGLVGAFLYVWMLIRIWISAKSEIKTYFVVVIVAMFFSSNFYISGVFVMQFIMLLSYLKIFEIDNAVNLEKIT